MRQASQSSRLLRPVIAFVALALILYTYHNCPPSICSSKAPTNYNLYAPYSGLDSISRTGGSLEDASKALVVASISQDDTSWLHKHFPDWSRYIYVMDDPNATLTVATNKGRESMAYLTYIIDKYNNLPDYMVFLHGKRYQWHNEDPMYDGIPVLKKLRLAHVARNGFVNLRCTWRLGCPSDINPLKLLTKVEAFLEPGNNRANTEASYAQAFGELFPGLPVPERVGVPCGAQFALSRWKIIEKPRSEYVRIRNWLINTELPDRISGRVLEYCWHIIMGMPPLLCPTAGDCFCQQYGLCNLTCSDDRCNNRYRLPPYARIPDDWPAAWPGTHGLPAEGWWTEEV